MPPHHSKSKLQAVLEESTSTAIKHPSVTTAVKSMASVLLGPRGKTPIENMLTMQHFQLWGFVLVVAGLVYIVWLMQKKLDNIDKQYKEQFVLLHRLFKSHQDLQVEVRKKNPASITTAAPTNPPPIVSLALEAEDEINFDEQPEQPKQEKEEEVREEFTNESESVSTAEPSESSDEEESVVQEDEDEEEFEADYEEYEENE